MSIFEKYQIVTIIGTHTISYSSLKQDGKMRNVRDVQTAPGRILRFQDDNLYRTGVLMLIDEQGEKDSLDFKVQDGCSLYTFPLTWSELNSSEVALYALKMRQFYKLLTDKEDECISHDSLFNVMRANKAVFEASEKERLANAIDSVKKDKGRLKRCEVSQFFKGKKYCTTVLI